MDIRKLAVVAGFAAGAALTFAPLAAADPAAVDPTLVTSTLDSEIALLNSLFVGDTTLAGVPTADVTTSTTPGVFDTITSGDVGTVQGTGTTLFDYLIYGVDPTKAGLAGDPGSYNDFNGALTEFDNAYNVELYSLFNGGTLDTSVGDYIQNSSLDHALTLANTTDAFDYLWNFGVGDLSGFLQTPLTFLDIPAI
jgi:hypothetical protein